MYLDGSLEDSLRQIQRVDRRPDLGTLDHARSLYEHRRHFYEAAADITIDIRENIPASYLGWANCSGRVFYE